MTQSLICRRCDTCGMPKADYRRYRRISVKTEVYDGLERLRARLGLRSIADVVRHLLEEALEEKEPCVEQKAA
jgi:hypothetical protein